MDFTDRTTASDAEFEARIAPFEAPGHGGSCRIFYAERRCTCALPSPTSLRPVGSGGRRRDTTSEEGQR